MFRFSKWYLDCVTDDGDAAILYWASLRWGLLRLRYGAAMFRSSDGQAHDRYTLRPGGAPVVPAGGTLRWECNRLGLRAEWRARADAIHRTLLEGPSGTVRWNCVMPRAEAQVTLGTHALTGLGYAEHLTMTVKPWQLPFDELRWGRHLSSASDAVWIAWRGAAPRTWVFVSGAEWRTAVITPHTVEIPEAGVTLAMDGARVLRSGRLIDSALRPVRILASLLPRWRAARETKWLARGTLSTPGQTSTGWVVHEVVRWP